MKNLAGFYGPNASIRKPRIGGWTVIWTSAGQWVGLGEKRDIRMSRNVRFLRSYFKPQQPILLLAAADDHHRFAGQVGGGEAGVYVGAGAVVDVGASLLDGAAGVFFCLCGARVHAGRGAGGGGAPPTGAA